MTGKSPTLWLTEVDAPQPPIETRASLEYLCRLRDQLEETTNRGVPCVVLEFNSLSPVGPRVQNHFVGNTEYDSIGVVEVGASTRPRSEEYDIEAWLYIQAEEGHLHEIAALYDTVRSGAGKEGPFRWTAMVPESQATKFIRSVSELEEEMVDQRLP